MKPSLRQLRAARTALSDDAATERSAARRDILDTAVAALENDIMRTELYAECMEGPLWRKETMDSKFCSKCGTQHR